MTTLDKLESLVEDDSDTIRPFMPYEEEAIVALAFDHPEFFTIAAQFLKQEMFGKLSVKYIIASLLQVFELHDTIPTRQYFEAHLKKTLTEDDQYDEIFRIIRSKSNPRDIPLLKDTILKWAKNRAYGRLFAPDALAAYNRNDFTYIDDLVRDANRIADVGDFGFWFLDRYEELFEPEAIEHRTTGFAKLDKLLNNGGPSPKEVVCWLASTGLGKSILLCNNAISSLKGIGPNGQLGQDVLLITFELDAVHTAMRCLGSIGLPEGGHLDQIIEYKAHVKRQVSSIKEQYSTKLLIHEMSPNECSVSNIYALMDSLKRQKNWRPDVVVVDYLDLMVSRNPAYNKDDYTRQKHISSELRGLAKNENVLLFTATQTNRSGANSDEAVDLTKMGESFGKSFALDYVISLSQTPQERNNQPIPLLRMHIAKNRNGPKDRTLVCEIDYNRMLVKEPM